MAPPLPSLTVKGDRERVRAPTLRLSKTWLSPVTVSAPFSPVTRGARLEATVPLYARVSETAWIERGAGVMVRLPAVKEKA